MSEKIVISYSRAKNPNKGQLEKDGMYYKVRLGAFNIFNSRKEFYALGEVEKLLTSPESPLYRRIKNGNCSGEADHPDVRGMTQDQIIQRNNTIDTTRVAFHIRDVWITMTDEVVKDMDVYGKVAIVEAWIRPAGPYGAYLEADLNDPDKNVCFSVRSISVDRIVKGVIIKDTKYIFTWDWVQEPGVAMCNKFDTINNNVTLNHESLADSFSLEITVTDVEKVMENKNREIEEMKKAGVNHESAANDLRDMEFLAGKLRKPNSFSNVVLDWTKTKK